MQKYVVGLLFNKNCSDILLVRKKRPARLAGLFNGPGGKIEPGEGAIEALHREFLEETGIDFQDWHLFASIKKAPIGEENQEIFFFRGKYPDWAHVVNNARGTDEELKLLPTQLILNAPTGILVPDLHWIIPMALKVSDSDYLSCTSMENIG